MNLSGGPGFYMQLAYSILLISVLSSLNLEITATLINSHDLAFNLSCIIFFSANQCGQLKLAVLLLQTIILLLVSTELEQ